MTLNRLVPLCLLAAGCWPGRAGAQTGADNNAPAVPPSGPGVTWSIHFQATSIGQEHGWFPSAYDGQNSLPSHPEHRASVTGTVFFAVRLNARWELVVDPEIAGGRGFGNVTGIAGFTNGEIPRVASATPTLYLARAYARYTIPLGPDVETIAGGPNQARGVSPARSISLISGKFAITDFFDNNSYSHDPRSQFMNWALMSNGAWDYPADTRGYTMGMVEELRMPGWSLRAASVMVPTTANGPAFDTRLGRNRGIAIEYEHDHQVLRRSGALRILAFENQEDAGSYREALHAGSGVPDLEATRRNGAKKYGFGLNAEQALSGDAGLFARYGWNDGKTESWAFTEIDRSLSAGMAVKGLRWGRRRDTVGLAAVRDYLSGDHRAFLAAGGYGFIIGDGRINYAPEQIVEAYYAFRVSGSWTVTGDYQHIANPAYNQDRGPVSVGTVRLHWEL